MNLFIQLYRVFEIVASLFKNNASVSFFVRHCMPSHAYMQPPILHYGNTLQCRAAKVVQLQTRKYNGSHIIRFVYKC